MHRTTLFRTLGVAVTLALSPMAHILPAGASLAGTEGCTPGYWKNHEEAWGHTPYSPSARVVEVFPAAAGLVGTDDTLMDALNYKGGPGPAGAARILLRAAVASLLNAGYSPALDFPAFTSGVLTRTNAALASGRRARMIDLAAQWDDKNNLDCPLS